MLATNGYNTHNNAVPILVVPLEAAVSLPSQPPFVNLPDLRRRLAQDAAFAAASKLLGRELNLAERETVLAAVAATLHCLEASTTRVLICPICQTVLTGAADNPSCRNHGTLDRNPDMRDRAILVGVVFDPLTETLRESIMRECR